MSMEGDDMKRHDVKRKFIIQLLTWLFGMVFLGIAVTVTLVYLIPAEPILEIPPDPRVVMIYRFAAVAFIVLLYFVAWTIRGFYNDTKDTMLADMGDIELENMKAQIEQVLIVRKGEKKDGNVK